ncbi:MAG: hypothetical protein O9308_13365 [Beijerinckiaceae bacterium]|nr:hypothetical protein [Beijerinckiaceae bacterium]
MTPFPRQAPFDLRFEPGYQIALREKLAAEERDRGRILAHFHLRLFELKAEYEALRRKYSPSQPRVPAGNSDGGQWTSGAIAATPFNILGILDNWVSEFASGMLPLLVAEADIPQLSVSILDWLGPGAFQQNSPRGATQFFSADRSRSIRFDITPETSHGLRPHINIEPGRRHIWLKYVQRDHSSIGNRWSRPRTDDQAGSFQR